jgi:glucuronokinase
LGGAALAVPVAALRAEVELRPASRLSVRHAEHSDGWASVSDLVGHTARLGHDGAERLVTATIVTLHRALVGRDAGPPDDPFEIVWRTDIPRSVGLAGSSALVIATLRALMARWDVALAPTEVARLALQVEVDELGIAAGWMDRAVQAHDAPTLVDQRVDPGAAVPPMRVVEPVARVDLVVAWDPDGASPSGRLHRSLRTRLDAAEPEVLRCVDDLVDAARSAAEALGAADVGGLAAAVGRTCALRDRLGALDPATTALVAAAADAGGVATSAGSGGAVLIVPTRAGPDEIRSSLQAVGVPTVPVQLGPDDRDG